MKYHLLQSSYILTTVDQSIYACISAENLNTDQLYNYTDIMVT